MKKIQYIIDAVKLTIIVYTDHFITTLIVRQTSLISVTINKLNLQLVQASQYLSQFNLDVQYRSKKQHIVSDALFCLLNSIADLRNFNDDSTLNEVFAYSTTLIKLLKEFHNKIIKEY